MPVGPVTGGGSSAGPDLQVAELFHGLVPSFELGTNYQAAEGAALRLGAVNTHSGFRVPVWTDPADAEVGGLDNPMSHAGSLIVGGVDGAPEELPSAVAGVPNSDGFHLILGGSTPHAPSWQFYEPMGVGNGSGVAPADTEPGSCSGNMYWDYSGNGAYWVKAGGAWMKWGYANPPLWTNAAPPPDLPGGWPRTGYVPFYFDSTPVTGGFYAWIGSWVKIAAILP